MASVPQYRFTTPEEWYRILHLAQNPAPIMPAQTPGPQRAVVPLRKPGAKPGVGGSIPKEGLPGMSKGGQNAPKLPQRV